MHLSVRAQAAVQSAAATATSLTAVSAQAGAGRNGARIGMTRMTRSWEGLGTGTGEQVGCELKASGALRNSAKAHT